MEHDIINTSVPSVEPPKWPTSQRQNGEGSEAPAAPPNIPPVFEPNSESVPVDGTSGIYISISYLF